MKKLQIQLMVYITILQILNSFLVYILLYEIDISGYQV